jgi:hypothetical protein
MNIRLRQVVRPATEDGDRDDQIGELLVPTIPIANSAVVWHDFDLW